MLWATQVRAAGVARSEAGPQGTLPPHTPLARVGTVCQHAPLLCHELPAPWRTACPHLSWPLSAAAEAQPWVLGLVFVGVALAAWSRLQHWRRRGGAGYQAPPGAVLAAANGSSVNGSGVHGAGPAAGVHRHHLVHGHLPEGSSGDLPSPRADV